MFKKTINYVDFNGDDAQETLYFHLSKPEMLDLESIVPRIDALQEKLGGEGVQPSTQDIRDLLDVAKIFIKRSYGVRSDDGKRFIKNETQYEEFTQTAVYEEFLMGLFTDPATLAEFVTGLIPKDMQDDVQEEVSKIQRPKPTKIKTIESTAELPDPVEATEKDLREMSKEELIAEYKKKLQG